MMKYLMCITAFSCFIHAHQIIQDENTFTLEITEDIPEDRIQITDSGEMYIKIDKIEVASRDKKWQCPYCQRWWKFGEKCKNEECPTNQWDNENN